MDNYKIFQIYYDESQKETLYDSVCVEPVYNPAPDTFDFQSLYYTLENKIILDKVSEEIEAEYVGVWSHKHYDKIWNFSQDQTYNKKDGKQGFIEWMDKTTGKKDFDVLGFHRHMNKHHKKHMLTMAERFHKNYNKLLMKLLKDSGAIHHVNVRPEYKFVTLMNYQVARKEIYLDYIGKVLKPVMNKMLDQTDKELQIMLFNDSNYKGDAMREGTLMKIGGKPYYTMHTFILERLFTLYLNAKNYKCISY